MNLGSCAATPQLPKQVVACFPIALTAMGTLRQLKQQIILLDTE